MHIYVFGHLKQQDEVTELQAPDQTQECRREEKASFPRAFEGKLPSIPSLCEDSRVDPTGPRESEGSGEAP